MPANGRLAGIWNSPIPLYLTNLKNAALPAGTSEVEINWVLKPLSGMIGPFVKGVQEPSSAAVVWRAKPVSGKVQLIQYAAVEGTIKTPFGPVATEVLQVLVVSKDDSARKFSL
jgi:hypothetical protein